MKLSESIAQARKQHHLTQEAVAEALGVSHVAVSKWERGLSYPDVTLLPAIARLFHMSLDELFDYEPRLTKEEARAITKELLENFQHMPMKEALTICIQKQKQYPTDYELMSSLGSSLWYVLVYGKDEDEMMEVIKYEEELLRKVLVCKDKKLHDLACASLSTVLLMQEKPEDALSILHEIEEETIDAQQLKAGVYLHQKEYVKAKQIYEENILKNVLSIRMSIVGQTSLALLQKQEQSVFEYTKKIEQVLALFDIKVPLAQEYLQCARISIKNKENEQAKQYLRKCLQSLMEEPKYIGADRTKKQEPMRSKYEVMNNFLNTILEEDIFHDVIIDDEIQNLIQKIQSKK